MRKYWQIKDIQKRQLAFLDDMVGFYNSDNRAVLHGSCQYSPTERSPGCAIGRCLPRKAIKSIIASNLDRGVGVLDIIDYMPTWMQEMGQSFLIDMQTIHDDQVYNVYSMWDETGLTEEGKQHIVDIKAKYKLN